MRLVGVKSLTMGNKLAIPVYTTSGRIVLNAGVTLTDSYINKLRQMRLSKVYINDDRFNDIEVMEPLDVNKRNTFAQVIKNIYEGLHKGKDIDESHIKYVAKEIVVFVRDLKDKGTSILSTNVIDEYIVQHSINVAILTAIIGNRMSFNFNQLCDLVAGAVIHDFGRENAIEEKPEHVKKGFSFMRKYRGLSLHSSIVCYEHHENYDGSGYPRKLKGNSISEFSRIVRIADLYDNALNGYGNDNVSVMPHQAYEHILALAGSVIDPEIVETFRDTIIFYPNGCTVLLSDGSEGVVVRQNMGSPQRPVIRIFNNSEITGEVDLLKSLNLLIKDVLLM